MYPKELVEYEKELIEAKLIEFGKQKNNDLRRLSIEEIKHINGKIYQLSIISNKYGWILSSVLAFCGTVIFDVFWGKPNFWLKALALLVLVALPVIFMNWSISKICSNRSTDFLTGNCKIQFFDDYYLLVYNDKKIFKRIKIKRSM